MLSVTSEITGKQKNASYRLEENWGSQFTMQGSAADSGEGFKITLLVFRAPSKKDAPVSPHARKVVNSFLELVRQEKYEDATLLFAANVSRQIQAPQLKQVRNILISDQSDQSELRKDEYRILATGVWYDSFLIVPERDQATYLEVVVSSDSRQAEIMSLSLKERMKQ